MKKLIGFGMVVLALSVFCSKSEAAGVVRGAKGVNSIVYSTSVSTIAANGPCAIYQVSLSTGASGEYVALFDSATATGITAAVTTNMKARCMYGSTTANSTCTYDPPLQFFNGCMAIDSAATGLAAITFERGRITQGY